MPKSPEQIKLLSSIEWMTDGIAVGNKDTKVTETTLADKMSEYIMRLGYSNDHTLSVILRLMTLGKVKVEFRDYRERLELASYGDMMARPQVIQMFDEFVAKINPAANESAGMTQRIVVQPKKK